MRTGLLIPGRVMRCFPLGRVRGSKGGTCTTFPVSADSYRACTMRTSCSPSSPEGSGSRFFRMQSEKYSNSGAN